MISDARGGHVSPGVYTEEKDFTYSVQSLGVTTLGLAGETQKGPAFEAVPIDSWSDFTDYFGGTSPEKFKGTNLPKYELPYIAKEYLKQSKQLQVVRVLGLSGYKAGKAWCINVVPTPAVDASGNTIESLSAATSGFSAYTIAVLRSKAEYNYANDAQGCSKSDSETMKYLVSAITLSKAIEYTYTSDCSSVATSAECPCYATAFKYGKFSLEITDMEGVKTKYNVSFDRDDSDYIENVFSYNPLVGDAPVYLDAVYENALKGLMGDAYSTSGSSGESAITLISWSYSASSAENVYGNYSSGFSGDAKSFIETFRCAHTPWAVSEVKGIRSGEVDVKKLFQFYTISDGNAANYQVKVSITNIRPDEGTFDVQVRDFYDLDESPVILEKFTSLSMDETSSNFIGLKIGTYDGEYEIRSKYITVRLADGDLAGSVPCGFLGYPIPQYEKISNNFKRIKVAYNDEYDGEVKPKRQYYGLNYNVLDNDILNYHGAAAYKNGVGDANPEILTNGFHLDSIIGKTVFSSDTTSAKTAPMVIVDGVSGFTFTAAKQQVLKSGQVPPRITTETNMKDSIYADVNLRKFTMYPYGGFDGWDIFREQRTNTNKFKASQYNLGSQDIFRPASKGELNETVDLNLPTGAISTDYYAYLAGYEQFANPQDIDINLFATPGIDFANNQMLVEDAIDIIEDKENRGGDALYLINSPLYAVGSTDELMDADGVVDTLKDTGIDTSYGATYWPWVKIYDSNAGMYVNLPAIKDVVRNMAETDNKSYPWFAAAGYNRGSVDCVKAVKKTKLADEDTLYEAGVNPIKSFAVDGVKVWGNKTLYSADSPLNRVNVRRLMIRVKKLVVDASKYLLFDQLDEEVDKQFKGLVEPILADVKSNRGISDYRVITELTAETRDQHILPAKILIKPIGALEYLSISFNVYPESVEFED